MIMHHKSSAHRQKSWCLELKTVNIIKESVYLGTFASMRDSPVSLNTNYQGPDFDDMSSIFHYVVNVAFKY
jgi:hypothetical protein